MTLNNREEQELLVATEDATLISQYKIKMPGYGKRMEMFTPEPTEEAPVASGGGGADDMLEDMFDLTGNKTNIKVFGLLFH